MKKILAIIVAGAFAATTVGCPGLTTTEDGSFDWAKAAAAGGAVITVAKTYSDYKEVKEDRDGDEKQRKQGDRIKAGRSLLHAIKLYQEKTGESARPLPVKEDGRWTVQNAGVWGEVYEETAVWYLATYGESLEDLILRLTRGSNEKDLPNDMELILRAIGEYQKKRESGDLLPEDTSFEGIIPGE